MGSNEFGNLGINNYSIKLSSSPCLVEDLVSYHCTKVACGRAHTIALMKSGEAFGWGAGELG